MAVQHGGSIVAIRRMASDDIESLAALVEPARAAGAFAGSSDPTGGAIAWMARIAPHQQVVAVEGGRLVGVLSPEVKAIYVDPGHRRRGVGRRLVEEAVQVERDRRRPQLLLGTLPDDPASLPFLEATGFAYHSTLWDMELPIDTAVPEPRWPAGVVPRSIAVPEDLDAYIGLFNAAFADHPTPMVMDRTTWLVDDLESFVADDVLVLADPARPGHLVGFCATDPGRRPSDPPHAEVWTIGVRPGRRGEGLGRELLRWGIRRLRSVSDLPVTLSVNGRNERALAMYEHEGFRRLGTRERWARAIG